MGLNFLFFTEPFDRDEGAYATVAQGILHGSLPYRDLFDHKAPAIYLWYALSFVLFGEHDWAPRLLATLALTATAWFVYDAARSLFSRTASTVALVVFSSATGLALLEPAVNTEPFMLLPMTAMLSFYLKSLGSSGQSQRNILIAGLLGACSLLTKQVTVWNVLVVGILIGFPTLRVHSAALRKLSIFVFAVLAPLVAVLGIYLAVGAFREFEYANVDYNILYSNDVPFTTKTWLLFIRSPFIALAAAPFFALSIAGCLSAWRRRTSKNLTVVLWAGASFLGVATTGRFLPHYYVQLLPAVALLSGCFVDGNWTLPAQKAGRLAIFGVASACVLVCVALNLPPYLAQGPNARNESRGRAPATLNAGASEQVGLYLRERTTPDTDIWQAGRESGMYFYAKRQPAIPMFYDRPFWLNPATLESSLKLLQESPPLYVVDALESVEEFSSDAPQVVRIRSFIEQNYELETTIAYAKIYRRRSS